MGYKITKLANNKFRLNVCIYYKTKQIRKIETFNGTKIAAEERYFEIKKELRKSAKESKSPIATKNFSEILTIYKNWAKLRSPSILSVFKKLKADLGHIKLSDKGGKKFETFLLALDSWYQSIRIESCAKTGKPYASGTINRYMGMISSSFQSLVNRGVIDFNPIKKGRYPKLKEIPRDTVLSASQEKDLFSVIQENRPWLYWIVLYAIQVPCRMSELINLTKFQLDLNNMTIRIKSGTTKNDQGIDKPIPPNMVDYFNGLPDDCEFVFYREDKNGQKKKLGDFKNAFRWCINKAGIRDFRFHDTRHISATDLHKGGLSEHEVMEIAGWKKPMLSIYYHKGGVQSSFKRINFKNREWTGHKPDTQDYRKVDNE